MLRRDGYTWTVGAYSKKRRVVWCMSCGKVEYLPADEEVDMGEYVCTQCGSVLMLADCSGKHPKQMTLSHLFVVPLVHKGWQVFDVVELEKHFPELGAEPEYSRRRRFSIWVSAKGKEIIATQPYSRSFYHLTWKKPGTWVIGRHNANNGGQYVYEDLFDIAGMYVAPNADYTSELKLRGFEDWTEYNDFEAFNLASCCCAFLKSNVIETLWKIGQDELLVCALSEGEKNRVEKYWPSIKVALRHGWNFHEDTDLYLDYLDGLAEEGKDMRSPKYLCPEDLRREHSAQVRRTHDRWKRERVRRELEEAMRYDDLLQKRMAKFAGFVVSDGDLEIRPLMTVQDFFDEGKEMRHCVFSNGYYKRADSLILSARVNGKRTETVEVLLDNFRIQQCRGHFNQDSDRHAEIVRLVNDNMDKIRNLTTKKTV